MKRPIARLSASENGTMAFIGSLLIVVGFFFLLRNLGLISGAVWDVVWPTVIILIGVKLFLWPRRWHRFWDHFGKGKKIKIE